MQLICGDCLIEMKKMDANSIDTVITDPPYGLQFMGKDWDHGIPGIPYWEEVLRVAKPGAFLLAFGGTRTFHRLTCAIEDAGWEIRDCMMWLYGCLSEDTEILTPDGWVSYETLFAGCSVLCYNVDNDSTEWGEVQEVYTYAISDTAYHIQSDSTDQIVTRDHRCLVERGGEYVFQRASTLQRQETIPVLESVPDMRVGIPMLYQGAGHKKQDVLCGLCGEGHITCADGANTYQETATHRTYLPSMRAGVLETCQPCGADEDPDVLKALQRDIARGRVGDTCTQGAGCLDARERGGPCGANDWRHESCMERRSNVLSQEGELCTDQICTVPQGVSGDGPQGRLCNGASSGCSTVSRATAQAGRGGSPRRSQAVEQRSVQPDAICEQQPAQAIRGNGATRPTLATVTPIHYEGTVWCVRVPTGAFVARRNGHVFVTGNSGFPKGHDISKAIDKAAIVTCPACEGTGINKFDASWDVWIAATKEHGGTRREWRRLCDGNGGPCTRCDGFGKVKGAEREVVGSYDNKDGVVYGMSKTRVVQGARPTITRSDGNITAPATDAAKLWDGWNVALKPAWEPIIVAMKPIEGTYAENALRWGVAGLNVDGARIGTELITQHGRKETWSQSMSGKNYEQRANSNPHHGRWPANLILDEQAAAMLDETVGELKSGARTGGDTYKRGHIELGLRVGGACEASSGGPSRYFQHCSYGPKDALRFCYTGKASRRERNAGLEGMPEGPRVFMGSGGRTKINGEWVETHSKPRPRANSHPTVKPLALMEYLCTLTKTPTGGIVLDPFAGSFTTGVACVRTGRDFIGIEIGEDYCEIGRRRIEHEKKQGRQLSLTI